MQEPVRIVQLLRETSIILILKTVDFYYKMDKIEIL